MAKELTAEDIARLRNEYEFLYLKERKLCAITRMAYTWALIVDLDAVGYKHRYCYESLWDARRAMDKWSGVGEPYGWHRDPTTGRRRPDGDHEREYIRW